jgi:cell division protein FtsW
MISSLIAAGLLIRVARESSEAKVVSLEDRRQASTPTNQRIIRRAT